MANYKKIVWISFFAGIAIAISIAGFIYFKEKIRLSGLEEKFTSWSTVVGQVASYEARFPLEVQRIAQNLKIPNSEESIEQEMFALSGSDMTYVVIASKYPIEITGDREENLRASLDGMLNAIKGAELVSSKYIVPFLGNNFLEFLIRDTANNSFLKGRLILGSQYFYQIYATYIEQTYDSDAFDYFVNSFDIK